MKSGKILGAAFVVALTFGTVGAQENYSLWSGSRDYSLNTGASGANVSATVTGFPVLVRLTSADSAVFSAAKAGGADIRFTKANGTRLQHQIERWDAVGRAAEIWVRADTIKANTAMQILRMRWGNSAAADSSKGSAVFDTSNGFVGVWHMEGAANVADATGNALTAVANGAPGSGAGRIGLGRTFDGATQYFSVADNARLNFTEQITLSLWVNATSWTGSVRLLQKSAPGDNNAGQYGLRDDSNNMMALNLNGVHTANGTAASPATGEWHLVHVTFDGAATAQYQDGALVASGSNAGPIATSTGDLQIARRPDATNYFNGAMDEVRVHKVARSEAWAKLEYENQKANQTLVQLASQVSIRGADRALSHSGLVARATSSGYVFSLPEGASAGARVSVADLSGRVVWSGAFAPGARELGWNGAGMAEGVHVARLVGIEGADGAVDGATVLLSR
jgi:hypothetical protein